MARFFLSFQVLLYLLAKSASSTTIIDASGVINRGASPLPVTSKGVVTLITSPGDLPSMFPSTNEKEISADVDEASGCIIVTSPGATLSTSGAASGSASSVAGSVVLTGVTSFDCEGGIADTRHGKTLFSIFSSKLNTDSSSSSPTLLIVAVEGDVSDSVKDTVLDDISSIFGACVVAATGADDTALEDLFEVEIVSVTSSDDAATVMSAATAAGARSPLTESSQNIITAISQVYSSTSTTSTSPSTSESILLCDDSYAYHTRSIQAKLSAWKRRIDRSLLVEQFGSQATQLLTKTMEGYDKATLSASGSDGIAATYRLEMRDQLKVRLEKEIRELFQMQIATLEKTTLKKLNAKLLSQWNIKDTSEGSAEQQLQDNAAAVRAASFAFDTAMDDLEIPLLSLTKTSFVQSMDTKLNDALVSFPDSVPAQLKDMKQVQTMASRNKKPTQRSMDVGLALVAMIRPDGFGNLQGFAGYSMGANSLTVGVHNDADAPETISQFGGSRPPFLRVQPKLNLDVEL